MDGRPWVQFLRAELQRHGLPRDYIERVVEEMGDHHSEVMKEHSMSEELAAERLGSVAWLAREMSESYPRRTFAGRHPWLTFVALPAPLLVGLWALVVFITLTIAWAFDSFGVPRIDWSPSAAGAVSTLATWAIRFLPPALVILWLCRTAQRSGIAWRLPAVGFSLVALLAFLFHSSLSISPVSGESTMSMGLVFGDGLLSAVHLMQLPVPFAVAGCWMTWHRSRFRSVGADAA